MIEITDQAGRSHYIAPGSILCVAETGPSSQWHGIRAIVKTMDGQTIEARETAKAIADAVAASVPGYDIP